MEARYGEKYKKLEKIRYRWQARTKDALRTKIGRYNASRSTLAGEIQRVLEAVEKELLGNGASREENYTAVRGVLGAAVEVLVSLEDGPIIGKGTKRKCRTMRYRNPVQQGRCVGFASMAEGENGGDAEDAPAKPEPRDKALRQLIREEIEAALNA